MKKASLIILLSLIFIDGLDAQVQLLFPDDGEELTDIAVSFKAKITSQGPHYLYVSKNADFSGEVIRRPAQSGKGDIAYNVQYFLSYQGKVSPHDRFVLTPGTWYWRVSGDGGLSFSETRTLIVNKNRPLTPPEWDISPEKPMFHMRLRSQVVDHAPNGDIAAALRKIIPDDLKEYVVLDLGHSFSFLPKERSLYDYSKIFDDLGYRYFFDMGSHAWLGRIASLGEMEKIFRDLDHCVGAVTPEIFYYIYNSEADRSMMDGALELCRKYGKKFLMADMNWKWAKWPYFNYIYYDIFRDRSYADYYIPQFKTTDPWGAYTNISAMQGMKLSGMVKDIGIWADWWCWEKYGQVNTIELEGWMDNTVHGNEKLYPFIQNIKQYIYGITYGSTVFALEANLQWHWLTAEPNDHYYRYLEPFVRAVVEEGLIPSEESIKSNFRVIVDTEYESTDIGTTPTLTFTEGNIWGDFLRSTYGIADIPIYNEPIYNTSAGKIIHAAYSEMIPDTDRYPSGIPFLPKPGVEIPVVDGEALEVLSIYDLDNRASVNRQLNKYYPESSNEAYARRIDSSIFVFNTIENHDIRQAYRMGIHYAGIDSLVGEIDLMSYVVGRCRSDGKTIFFQTNAYVRNPATWDSNGGRYDLAAYPTVLNFKCQVEPELQTEKLSAFTRREWDAASGILTLEIDHSSAGAVNFTLTGSEKVNYDADSIQLNEAEVRVRVSESIQLTGTVFPESMKGKSLSWRSLDPNIARVTVHGRVTGSGEGTVKLVAEINDISDTVLCHVTDIPVTGIDVTVDTLDLLTGDQFTIPVNILPLNATDEELSWTVRKSFVASVDESGLLRADHPGECFVVGRHVNTGFLDSCLVRVRERLVEVVNLKEDTLFLHPEESYQLVADVLPANAYTRSISWSTDETGFIYLNSYGKVYALDAGEAFVFATNLKSGVKDSCLVKVTLLNGTTSQHGSDWHEYNYYPNPAPRGSLLNIETNTFMEASIYNQHGQRVLPSQKGNSLIQIPTSALNPGLYLLRIQSGSLISTHKIVIQ